MLDELTNELAVNSIEQVKSLRPMESELIEWMAGKGLTLKQAATLTVMIADRLALQARHQLRELKVTPLA